MPRTLTVFDGSSISGQRYSGLDGLRGIAAIGVLIWHLGKALPGSWAPAGGYLAVDLFFLLSGFVLTNAYQARILGGMRLSDFMRARLVRLYPLYLVGAAAGLILTSLIALAGKELGSVSAISIAALSAALLLSSPTRDTWSVIVP